MIETILAVLAAFLTALLAMTWRQLNAARRNEETAHELARACEQKLQERERQWAADRAELLAQIARLTAEQEGAAREREAMARHHQALLHAQQERFAERERAWQQQEAEREAAWREKLALLEQARQALTREFQAIAHALFEEKSQRFAALNQEQMTALLTPLRERLDGFRQKIEEIYLIESKDRAAIVEQVRQLVQMNQMLSAEARQLTQALKGTQQTQGAWGEVVLERLLELAGLTEGREYVTQMSHRTEEGVHRPDVILFLPGERLLIIDAKVSLTAYADAVAAEEPEVRERHLKAHVQSLRRHIDGLAKRHYPALYPDKTLDFVILFVAVEPAFLAALAHEPNLFAEAWQKNVLLTSPSTLLFVLRTVEHLWRQEAQNRNAQEIAQKGAELYDKFVLFLEAMDEVKQKLAQAQQAFDTAQKRLSSGRGNLIAQAEQLKALGVKPKKAITEGWRLAADL